MHPSLSVLLSSLPLDFVAAVRQAAELGFGEVDVVAVAERPAEHLNALADAGVLVRCAAVGRGLPEGHALDAPSVGARRAALEEMKRQVADAARLGATHCYIVSGRETGPAARRCFTEACALLADYAGQRMVRLCVEPIPGRALPSAASVLAWLEEAGHDNLALLLDVGHCLISAEDPAAVVRQAGPRLGYVHLDDNDGVSDLHWPLLSGRLTQPVLRATLAALEESGYQGALALELSADNPNPVGGLREGKALLEQFLRA